MCGIGAPPRLHVVGRQDHCSNRRLRGPNSHYSTISYVVDACCILQILSQNGLNQNDYGWEFLAVNGKLIGVDWNLWKFPERLI